MILGMITAARMPAAVASIPLPGQTKTVSIPTEGLLTGVKGVAETGRAGFDDE
jgi:hypothetical protein